MFTLLALGVALAIFVIGFLLGRLRPRGAAPAAAPTDAAPGERPGASDDPPKITAVLPKTTAEPAKTAAAMPPTRAGGPETPPVPPSTASADGAVVERARLIRSLEAEGTKLRRERATDTAAITHLSGFAADRRLLISDLARARAETARFRQIVVDIENDAPPPLLDGPGAPDDLKLIVGVGPVLERMLHQLGVTTYRQIARWSEHDIDEFDARLPEFPGRIRRDGWVTQARALHQSKFGTSHAREGAGRDEHRPG